MKIVSFLYVALVLFPLLGVNINAQSKFLINPGVFYNGSFLSDEVGGLGVLLGIEYKPNNAIGIELRTRCGFYFFRESLYLELDENNVPYYLFDGKSLLEYGLASPQIGIVPKFYQDLDVFYDGLFLFLESEFSVGLMSGQFKYNGEPSAIKRFTEPISFYAISIGLEQRIDNSHFKKRNWIFFGSVGYSSLNFRENIRKHQPKNYQGRIPNQDTGFMLNFGVKFLLGSKNELVSIP